jgi:hypothetical protein
MAVRPFQSWPGCIALKGWTWRALAISVRESTATPCHTPLGRTEDYVEAHPKKPPLKKPPLDKRNNKSLPFWALASRGTDRPHVHPSVLFSLVTLFMNTLHTFCSDLLLLPLPPGLPLQEVIITADTSPPPPKRLYSLWSKICQFSGKS